MPVELSIGMNKTGVIALKGNTVIAPLSAKLALDVKNIQLENFQPYFDKFVRLDVIDGAVHIDGNVTVAKQKQDKLDVKFKGDTGISSLLTREHRTKPPVSNGMKHLIRAGHHDAPRNRHAFFQHLDATEIGRM